MRTPVRLAAALVRFQIKQAVHGKKFVSPVYRWSLSFAGQRLVPVANYATVDGKHRPRNIAKERAEQSAKALRAAPWAGCPVLWLTGPVDIMGYSATPGLARWLQDAGRTVFVESDGIQLRRRIHSFRPDGRLYLTIRFYGTREPHDAREQAPGAFAQAVESIRIAQLSGFLLCGHVVIEAATELSDIKLLLERLQAMHLDGVVVTRSEDGDSAGTDEKVIAARELIGNAWWRKFSRMTEQAIHAAQPAAETNVIGAIAGYAQNSPELKRSLGTASHGSAVSGEEAAAQ
jgi:hypothetical protein